MNEYEVTIVSRTTVVVAASNEADARKYAINMMSLDPDYSICLLDNASVESVDLLDEYIPEDGE